MSKLRYICGGEDGSVAVGSEPGGCEAGLFASMISSIAGDEDVSDASAATGGTEALGDGVPLTIWSSFASDMVLPKREGKDQCPTTRAIMLIRVSW